MAVQGPNPPATTADSATVGSFAWSNPNNAQVSDNAYATASDAGSGGNTHYLKATNFSFSIPAGATINGILVEIEHHASGNGLNNVLDNEVKIVKSDGTIGLTNKADTVNKWATSDVYISYGGAADLWGEVWAASDINNANFGVVLSANLVVDTTITAFVDHIRITVTYTEATTTSTSSSTSSTSSSTSTSTSISTSTSSTSTSVSTSSTSSSTSSTTTLIDIGRPAGPSVINMRPAGRVPKYR